MSGAETIPRLPGFDHSLAFLADGYLFGQRRYSGSDAFRTRILGRPVTVTRGADAARTFYEGDRFSRERAMPTSVLHLLQDEGSVQSLDQAAHRHRKSLFARMLMDPAALRRLRALFAEEWSTASGRWNRPVVLHDELIVILTRVALRWVGLDADAVDVPARAKELGGMVENAGRFGPPNWLARVRRHRTEQWAAEVIADVRAERITAVAESPLAHLAAHRNDDGSLLPVEIAAVELINVLRPIVAVGRFIVFAAMALHRHSRWRDEFAAGNTVDIENFVNEVRRFYPSFPVIGGTVMTAFDWHGHRFGLGEWVMLDIYATNHDERIWLNANRFAPERFRNWNGDRNTLVPQGGGELLGGHRCPGERATIELMIEAVTILTSEAAYTVPDQDLRVSLRRFPALPESGFVIDPVG